MSRGWVFYFAQCLRCDKVDMNPHRVAGVFIRSIFLLMRDFWVLCGSLILNKRTTMPIGNLSYSLSEVFVLFRYDRAFQKYTIHCAISR